MKVYTDFPYAAPFDADDASDARAWWDTLGPRWVRANLVTDPFGLLTGSTNTSDDLTGGADRRLLTALRDIADVVVIGGETVRAEPLAVPTDTPVVIVSRTATVPETAIRRARGGITVLHHQSAKAPAGTNGVVLTRFTGSSIIKAIRALGHSTIVVEGGPTLIERLLASGSIDEFCLTVSPRAAHTGSAVRLPTFYGELALLAHDTAGYRYWRRRLNGAPRDTPSERS